MCYFSLDIAFHNTRTTPEITKRWFKLRRRLIFLKNASDVFSQKWFENKFDRNAHGFETRNVLERAFHWNEDPPSQPCGLDIWVPQERHTPLPHLIWAPHFTRWSPNLSSKVNVPHVIDFRALCGSNLVTCHPEFVGGQNAGTTPSG